MKHISCKRTLISVYMVWLNLRTPLKYHKTGYLRAWLGFPRLDQTSSPQSLPCSHGGKYLLWDEKRMHWLCSLYSPCCISDYVQIIPIQAEMQILPLQPVCTQHCLRLNCLGFLAGDMFIYRWLSDLKVNTLIKSID